MWTLTILLMLSGPEPLTVTIHDLTLPECAAKGREMEARYLTQPARSYRCTRD